MAMRKVYFFKVCLFESSGKEISYTGLKDKLSEIIENKGVNQGGYWTLDLTDDVYEHVVWDIVEYKDNKLFGRLSKQKPSNSVVGRDYRNFQKKDLNITADEKLYGIEQYTYGSLDYATGIFSIIGAQGAPTESILKKVFERYNNNYYIELEPIPNHNSIKKLYSEKDAEVSSLEVEIPLPDAPTLQHVFGWKDKELLEILGSRSLTAKVLVKASARQTITYDSVESQNLIKAIWENIAGYKKAKLKARTARTRMRDYDFFEQYFSYPVDIVFYHIVDYDRVYYTVDELMEIYRTNIIQAFVQNKDLLRTVISR
ncbi:MAG: hypothetical protein HFH87_03095 [Lachnospiraceae bacterium]|nr:hypothetical protein [Lachnospiraceae bacterium]